MQRRIFYSWQSVLPPSTNRSFIEKALENAVKAIRQDESLTVEPVVDRDTFGEPGSPAIVDTILRKIREADAFVADVSIIHPEGVDRRSPNPNVLVELGYAIKALGWERIIVVANTAFGGLDLLPFDIAHHRALRYDLSELPPEGDPGRAAAIDSKKKVRLVLEAALEENIRTIVTRIEASQDPTVVVLTVVQAVQERLPSQGPLARSYMRDFIQRLSSLAPVWTEGTEMDDVLVDSLAKTIPLVLEFSRVCEAISIHEGNEAATALYDEWGLFLERYVWSDIGNGNIQTDYDFFRFLGQELFVGLFSFLLRDRRWGLIGQLLGRGIYASRSRTRGPGIVRFDEVSVNVELLYSRNTRLRTNRITLHGDLLKERHSTAPLAAVVPFQQLADADFLLYLRTELEPDTPQREFRWRPWTAVFASHGHLPRFVVEAESVPVAKDLCTALGIPDVATLKERIAERPARLSQLFNNMGWTSPWPTADRIAVF